MKITYLFGAGASANALPVVADIPQALAEFKEIVQKLEWESRFDNLPDNVGPKPGGFEIAKNGLANDISWLINSMENYASVDTLAKKFFLKKQLRELERLKVVISLWFNYIQIKKRDKRYNSFFASILVNSWINLPNSINILSWNYDSQFELSYNEFSDHEFIREAEQSLRVVHRHSDPHFMPNLSAFNICKINGTASFRVRNGARSFDFDNANPVFSRGMDLMHKYAVINPNGQQGSIIKSNISFAWECEDSYLQTIGQAIKDTQVLVVIGYSMPFFNRAVDQAIFAAMKLTKVYIQDRSPQGIKDRFLSLKPGFDLNNIVLINSTDFFYLPDELSL